jgi:acyl-coenzyme A thioesterase PaaI-like protein
MATTMETRWKARLLKVVTNVWGPYLLSGIRVTHVAPDFRTIDVRMALRPWNRNIVGTHFGGSLFAMADPWFMVALIELLGPDYVVWDKTGTIRFRKPGRGTVRARFEISEERVAEIRAGVEAQGKVEPVFVARIIDAGGELVAEVEKLLSIRRKRPEAGVPSR